jgi:hypothetical protein
MNTTLRRFGWFLIAWFVAVVAMFIWMHALGGKDEKFTSFWQLHPYYTGLLNSTITIIPALVFAPKIARAFGGWSSAVGRACWALAFAPVAFGIGNAFWFYYNTCTKWPGPLQCSSGVEVPYPSWADAGYLAMLPLILLALHSMSKVLAVRGKDWLAVAGVFVALLVPTALLTWNVSIGSADYGRAWLYDPDGPGFFAGMRDLFSGSASIAELSNLISGIYVVLDVILIATALVLIIFSRRVAGGLFFRPILVIALACIVQYVADMFFFKRVFDETFYNGDISDAVYSVAMFLLVTGVYALGTVYRSMTSGMSVAPPVDDTSTPGDAEGVA